jgi:hypothetical protein
LLAKLGRHFYFCRTKFQIDDARKYFDPYSLASFHRLHHCSARHAGMGAAMVLGCAPIPLHLLGAGHAVDVIPFHNFAKRTKKGQAPVLDLSLLQPTTTALSA